MANLTTASTFNYSLQGNRRVYTVDVTSANFTTSDTVSVPCSAITSIISAQYRIGDFTTVASTVLVGPFLSVGASANDVVIVRSSLAALPVRFTCEGR